MSEIHDLWKEHCSAPFPSDAYQSDTDLVSLNSAASGVISSYLEGSFALDPDSVVVLERCAEQLYPEIDGFEPQEREYFSRLLRMIRTVHAALSHRCPDSNQQH